MHLESIPLWLWALFALVGAAVGYLVWRQRRERAELVARFRARQRRNAAHYRAWQWVFGRRRNLQLPDYSQRPEE
jgi:hypothetical protein